MSGHLVNGTPVMNYAQPPSTLLPHKSDLNNTSSMLSSSTGNKRKASRPSPTPPPSEPKKQRVQSPVVSSATEEEPMAVGSSTSSTEDEMSGSFDIDLPDLDIFNGDFSFSELLADIDLECEADPSFQPLSSFVHSVPR
ncbi:hypothetical protein BHE74_00027316 [Ensete ventricosum]|nr:hypothetical protein GW17_00055123 [Ensete ventricosum]RWW65381.1 hypothetical protein BHE74_00027316 [Ensete ventricosum]RZR96758.1 hypothetical protein BHM03_00025821 [Ensete ventricosum]